MSARLPNESTQAWLERLIVTNAPADVRANVQAILEMEIIQVQVPQSGKD